jgi:hypothetical protein
MNLLIPAALEYLGLFVWLDDFLGFVSYWLQQIIE